MKLKLTYFDFPGGRGETARVALSIGGVAFEDNRVSREDWLTIKSQTPFGAMPVLEVDGKMLSQSNTINRYIGRLVNLYPEDPWQAALCDEIMDAVEDATHKVSVTFYIQDEEERKVRRQALAEGPLLVYVKRLGACLEERGGEYFADNRFTIADLKVFYSVRHLRSGVLDHIPTDLVDANAPNLVEHFERVQNHPGVKAYYANR